MNEVLSLIESLVDNVSKANGHTAIKNVGLISCRNSVEIQHIPFYEPSYIMVLSGRKVVYDSKGTFVCETGTSLTVPAPSTVTMRNEAYPEGKNYKALIVSFSPDDLARLRKAHNMEQQTRQEEVDILTFDRDETLTEAVIHYLSCRGDEMLINHRLLEILLILAEKDKRLLSYVLSGDSWSSRLRILLGENLERNWIFGEVCEQLATSESSLRRNLQREKTCFRELLSELRLGTALGKLLQTSQPVYQIAYDCGYQSVSRFTSNFRKRFGLPPTEFRSNMTENGQNLGVSGQS